MEFEKLVDEAIMKKSFEKKIDSLNNKELIIVLKKFRLTYPIDSLMLDKFMGYMRRREKENIK